MHIAHDINKYPSCAHVKFGCLALLCLFLKLQIVSSVMCALCIFIRYIYIFFFRYKRTENVLTNENRQNASLMLRHFFFLRPACLSIINWTKYSENNITNKPMSC